MFFSKTTTLTLLASLAATTTTVQSASLISGVSSSCSSAIAGFLLGDLGNCLSLTSLISVVSGGSDSSIISPLDSYLNTICSSSPCSNSTINSALSTITSQCSSDLANNTQIAVLLYDIVKNYNVEYEVGCLKYNGNSTRCITQTLTDIQSAIGQPITLNYLASLLSGSNKTQLTQLENLNSGVWCTDCVKATYDVVYASNKTLVDNSGIAKTINSDCGSSFTNGSYPSDVSNPLTSTTATGSATGAASTASSTTKSSDAMRTFGFGMSKGMMMGLMGAVGVVVGAGVVMV